MLVSQLQRNAERLMDADDRKAANVFNRAVVIGSLATMIAEWAADQIESQSGGAR